MYENGSDESTRYLIHDVRSNLSEKRSMDQEYDFISHMTRFCRVARSYGLMVGPRETSDAVRALGLVNMMDRGRVYWTLRSLLVSRQEDILVFDELFQRFWDFEPIPVRPPSSQASNPFGRPKEFRQRPGAWLMPEHDDESDETLVQIIRTGASAEESSSRKDLTVLRSDELSELSRIASRIVRALASRPGRRRKRHKRKGIPDLRGAFRLNLTSGGDIIRLPRLRRVPRVPRLLVMLDVSGSMERHARLLLQLIFAVSQHTKRVETFLFSTSVTRVTRELNSPSFSEALQRISHTLTHWSSGTRIGESMNHINTDFGYLLNRYTTVFLLSDGWDTGDPDELAREMKRLQRRTNRVVWLNPLLGTKDYEPLTRGLQAAMPFVDHFASARDINQLKRLPQLLRR